MMNTQKNMKKNSSVPHAHGGLASEGRKSALGGGGGVIAVVPRAKVVELPTSIPSKPSPANTDTSQAILREKDSNSQFDAGRKKWRTKNAPKDIKKPVNDGKFVAMLAGSSLENIPIQNQSYASAYLKNQEVAGMGVTNFNEESSVEQLVALTSALEIATGQNLNSKSNKHRKKAKYSKKKSVHARNDTDNMGSLPILPVMEEAIDTRTANEGCLSVKQSKRFKKTFGRNKKKQQMDGDQVPYHMGYTHDGYPCVAERDFSTNAEGAAILASIGQLQGCAKYSSSPQCDECIQVVPPPESFLPQYDSQIFMYPTHPMYMGYGFGSAQFTPEMYHYPSMAPECYQPHQMMNPYEGVVYYNQGGGECIMTYDPSFYSYPYYHNGEASFHQNNNVDRGGERIALNIDAPSFEPKGKK
mmetsp:Transcript_18561/g.36103  ORF Transcript_18561/g.36103 Transcript_18561/m.36103 type:complete len:414 (-) Transcript_18561:151-1392(-)